MPPRLRRPRRRSPDGEMGPARSAPPGRRPEPASVNGEGSDGNQPPREPSSILPASPGPQPPQRRPKLKKLRFALVFLGLAVLAFVSWIFGIMMAVASDLPQLENRAQFEHAQNSVLYDVNHQKIATLTNNKGRILVGSADIAPVMKEATVAIEDQRFYEHRGHRLPGHRPSRLSGHPPPGRHPGSLHDHPAVRQERASRAGQPHAVREAPGGGPGLPARAPLGQGQDPHRVPERDLLRRGRLRHRGGGEDLLRLGPPGLRRPTRPLRLAALPLGGGHARRPDLEPERL